MWRNEGIVTGQTVALRSIEHHGAKVSVQYRRDDLEVMTVEIDAHGALDEPMLRGRGSWHLVVEGEALFQQDGKGWELLPGQSMTLDGSSSLRIVNPSPERLRIISVVLTAGDDEHH